MPLSAKFSAWARASKKEEEPGSQQNTESAKVASPIAKGDGDSSQNINMKPKAYAPKHAEEFNKNPKTFETEKKKKRSRRRSRSASHSPSSRTRKTHHQTGGGDEGGIPSITVDTTPKPLPKGKPGLVAPKPPGVSEPLWNGKPKIPPPMQIPKAANPGQYKIPLNSQPGPWNKTPYSTTLQGGPQPKIIPPPKGLPPSNHGQNTAFPKMDKAAFMDQYLKQSYNYNDSFKQYKPGNLVNAPFFNKLKNMKPGEYDDWYSQQYLAWNQAQVKAKVSDVLIPIPPQKRQAPENVKGELKQPKQPEARAADEPCPAPQTRANFDNVNDTLSEDNTNLLSSLLDKTCHADESNPAGTTSLASGQLDGGNDSLLTDQILAGGSPVQVKPQQVSAMRKNSPAVPFNQYLKAVMMPVMIKGVPEAVFWGRDRHTGCFKAAVEADKNPCRLELDKLLACYRKAQVSDKEMISIRNGLADCIASNTDYFYARKARSNQLKGQAGM